MSITFTQLYQGSGNLVVGNTVNIQFLINTDRTDSYYTVSLHAPLTHQLQFVPNSIQINGISAPQGTTNQTIPLPDIIGTKSYTVSFDAKIIDDTPNPIEFKSSLEFLPLSTLKRTILESNTSSIAIIYNNLDILASLNYNSYNSTASSNVVYVMDVKPDFNLAINDTNFEVGKEYDITYTVTNTSNVVISDLLLIPTKASNVEFVLGSASIDGISNPSIDVNLPININKKLLVGDSLIVKLKFKVNNTSIRKLTFSSSLSYTYYINGIVYTETLNSNNEIGYVYDYTLSVTQNSSNTLAQLFDTLKFTIDVENTGNDDLSNVTVFNVAPNEFTVDLGSFSINNIPTTITDLTKGIALGTLHKGDKATIIFDALVDGVDYSPIDVTNSVYATFDDNIGVDNIIINDTVNALDLIITIYSFMLTVNGYSMPQAPSKARIGDTLSYSFYIKNIGNVTAQNVVFADTLPLNLSFQSGSLFINSISSNQDPNLGVTIPNISKGSTSIISFQANITDYFDNPTATIPQAINSAYAVANATVKSSLLKKQFNSSAIINPIESAYVNITAFSGTPTIVGSLEFLTYTVVIENTGIGDAINVYFNTTANPLAKFVANSVVSVDSTGKETPTNFENPEQGWVIPLIKAKERLTFRYKLQVL